MERASQVGGADADEFSEEDGVVVWDHGVKFWDDEVEVEEVEVDDDNDDEVEGDSGEVHGHHVDAREGKVRKSKLARHSTFNHVHTKVLFLVDQIYYPPKPIVIPEDGTAADTSTLLDEDDRKKIRRTKTTPVSAIDAERELLAVKEKEKKKAKEDRM